MSTYKVEYGGVYTCVNRAARSIQLYVVKDGKTFQRCWILISDGWRMANKIEEEQVDLLVRSAYRMFKTRIRDAARQGHSTAKYLIEMPTAAKLTKDSGSPPKKYDTIDNFT